MNLRPLVALLLVTAAHDTITVYGSSLESEPVSYDVTTIYRLQKVPSPQLDENISTAPGTIEMHARTNARGLPLRFKNGFENMKEPHVNVDLPPCWPGPFACNWTLDNITNQQNSVSEVPPLKYEPEGGDTDWTSGSNFTKPREFNGTIKFDYTLSQSLSSSGFFILLMEKSATTSSGNAYLIHFNVQYYIHLYIYSCTENDKSTVVRLPDGRVRYCTQKHQEQVNYLVQHISRKLTCELKRANGYLSVILDYVDNSQNPRKQTFQLRETTPIEATSISIGSMGFSGVVSGLPNTPVMSVYKTTGSLVSPPLPPNVEKVCVSLVMYTDKEATISLLIQQGQTLTPISELLLGEDSTNGTWLRKQLIANVPSRTTSETRVVIMVTKQLGETVLIQRVSGCNTEDPEDIYVVSDDKMDLKASHGGDVAHVMEYTHLYDNTCINGGMKVKRNISQNQREGCICPAGFAGDNCERPCGENRYGDDCGGICSMSKRGCKGMLLCRPELGCTCAPGLQKKFCVTPCNKGKYGSNCLQTCGECEAETCDPYTGTCHQGCLPGFYPPFCKEVYSYISNVPIAKADGFHCVAIAANLVDTSGYGDPRFYQVQFKKESEVTWKTVKPQPIPEKTKESALKLQRLNLDPVCGLASGTTYQLRVVLIDESGVTYEGDRVKSFGFSTPCVVPQDDDYNFYRGDTHVLSVVSSHAESFILDWKFPYGNLTWCVVTGYEVHVKMGWRWVTHKVEGINSTRKEILELLSGKRYPVKVRAVTTHGQAAFSPVILANTLDQAPDHVTGLEAKPTSGQVVKVSWGPPLHPAGTMRLYYITYQCLHLLACPSEDCSTSAGKIEVVSTDVVISGLLPYAFYNVSVVGLSGSLGPASSVHTATLPSPSHASPADGAIISRSNSSFDVTWEPPVSCRHANGYLSGYRYELLSPGQELPLLVGSTSNNSAVFQNLKPHTTFVVRVFTVNSAGWSGSHGLEIGAKTRATSPEVVGDLVVYKRGRRMLGVRWSKPRLTYGALQSFTISHRPSSQPSLFTGETIRPAACVAWPHLFCHTIKNLKQDTDYIIGVQARNSEVSEDGDEVTVTAITKEGAPDAPSFVHVVNKTATSLTVEWGLPDMSNGQLRSFLVNVEETDSFNSSDCCQYFPIREVIVSAEQGTYHYKRDELRPASSYEISVSAKTVAMGPAVITTSHTRPPTPSLSVAPKLLKPATLGTPLTVSVKKTTDYDDRLISGYLLLVEGGASDNESVIRNEWLSAKIKETISHNFSLVAEISQDEFPANGEIVIQPGQVAKEGHYGMIGMPSLTLDTKYRLVWVLVLEYSNTLSVGLVAGEPFSAT